MKMIYQRILAILIMCIPGVIAIYGWTLMRDVLFDSASLGTFLVFRFSIGLILFLLGIAIIGGFIFRHDKKRNKIQPKLLRKKEEK
ncbi:DUF2627 family protein [Polycladospora coralii]|nr:DUF2627 family protein [Polycladospora coralii]